MGQEKMNFLWVDVESTGLDFNRQDIIQLACIAVIDGVEQKQIFNEFCQPTRYDNIDQIALDTHGITIEQMRTFQTQAEMLDKFIAFVQQFNTKFAIAGYNVSFDKSFVGATFSKHGKSHEFLKLFTLDVHDTYKRAQEVKKDLVRTPNLKLNTLAKAYDIPIDAHDALSDIRATIKLDVIISSLLGENTQSVAVDTSVITVDREFQQPAQLHLHSTYNMIDSIPSVEDWAQWCKDTGTPGFSIVDHGNAISMFDILNVKEKYGVEGIPGVGLNFIFPDQMPEDFSSVNAWAITKQGYFNLMKLSSLGYTRAFTQTKTALTIPVVTTDEIKQYQDGIIFGTGDVHNIIGRELLAKDENAAIARLDQYHDIFQILYYEFAPTDINYIYDHKIGFKKLWTNWGKLYNRWLFKQACARDYLHYCFPVSGAHFIDKNDKIVQDCVSKNSAKGRYYHESYHAMTAKDMYIGLKRHLDTIHDNNGAIFNEDLFEKWIKATYRLLNGARTHIKIEYDYHLPEFDIPEHIRNHTSDYQMQTYHLMMQKIKQHGRWRDDPVYVERFKKEVNVIMKNPTLNFIPYFLLYEDICAYARNAGFLQNIARGSAGGSLISYYLKIIHVDPIDKDLPFERFLSNARIRAGSFPDIDADFGDQARPSIIKYLQEKYGLGFAQVSTLSRMKTKNAIKDVMWALYGRNRNDPEIKAVCDTIPDSPQGVDEKDFLYGYIDKEGDKHDGIIDQSPTLVNFFKSYPDVERMTKKLIGTIRGWSRHASAFVISTVDLAHSRVPTMTMEDKEIGRVTVTQYDASMVEKCGLVKADILGIKTLTAVTECVNLIKERTGKDFLEEDDRGIQLLYRLPEDEGVYADFYKKDTDSSFQFNTALIKGLIQDFCPTERKHLMNLTALARPGAMDSRMDAKAVVLVKYADGTVERHPQQEYDLWKDKLKKQETKNN
jgi:DNA polymerase-3 subunit alpha